MSERRVRCGWARTPSSIAYHDAEWGVPVHDDRVLFEFLVLEDRLNSKHQGQFRHRYIPHAWVDGLARGAFPFADGFDRKVVGREICRVAVLVDKRAARERRDAALGISQLVAH